MRKRLTWITATPRAQKFRTKRKTRSDGGPAMLRCGHSPPSSLALGGSPRATVRSSVSGCRSAFGPVGINVAPSHQSTAPSQRTAPSGRATPPTNGCPPESFAPQAMSYGLVTCTLLAHCVRQRRHCKPALMSTHGGEPPLTLDRRSDPFWLLILVTAMFRFGLSNAVDGGRALLFASRQQSS